MCHRYSKGKNRKNSYGDGDIPTIDLPQTNKKSSNNNNPNESAEPLPESTRPRKDGPGGE